MGGGGKGAQESTKIELDPDIKKAALENLDIANEVAAIGYTPYEGPTHAGFTPQQLDSMQNTNRSAGAFGMASQNLNPNMSQAQIGEALTGMMGPNASAGGFSGYSASPMFYEALNQMPQAQRGATESFTMNPFTGAPPTNPTVPAPEWRYGGEDSWWLQPENQETAPAPYVKPPSRDYSEYQQNGNIRQDGK